MTVEQLIKALKKFPKDLTVEVYQYECRALEEATEVCTIKYPKDMCEDGSPERVVVIK